MIDNKDDDYCDILTPEQNARRKMIDDLELEHSAQLSLDAFNAGWFPYVPPEVLSARRRLIHGAVGKGFVFNMPTSKEGEE